MKPNLRALALGTLLLIGAGACVDLTQPNFNEPERDRVLRTATDLEALVAGSFQRWWMATHSYSGISMTLGAMSFQQSSSVANQGVLTYGAIPRIPVRNQLFDADYNVITYPWTNIYRALAAVADAMRVIESSPQMQADLGAERLARLRTHARFVQGLGHASIAVLHYEGFIVDERVELISGGVPANLQPVGYTELMDAAFGYWDEALQLARAGGFANIPTTWMGVSVTPAELVGIIHGLRADFRASLARTPEERRDVGAGGLVDWSAVIADVDAATPFTLSIPALDVAGIQDPWWDSFFRYMGLVTWSHGSYYILGMAHQPQPGAADPYREWLELSLLDRQPDLASGPFLIQTPDRRFPQGATVAAQQANPGLTWSVPANIRAAWSSPGRGTWRWSFYHARHHARFFNGVEDFPFVSEDRLRLLAAEGHYVLGDPALAAALINVTRVGQGQLSPATAAGANESCVPRLPDGSCGGLFEMLKWERRNHAIGVGPFAVAWYFDSRGWGDLYRGTAVDFPIPISELFLIGAAPYTRGGLDRPGGAPGSSYAWPRE